MKILFYCDTVFSFGGVQRVLSEIAKALTNDHDITILTTDACKDKSMYGYDKSKIKFINIHYNGAGFMERFMCKLYSYMYKNILPKNAWTSGIYAKSSFLPTYRKLLVNAIGEGDYDVVIGVHAFFSLHLASVKEQIRAKVIGWMHNSYYAFFEKKDPYLPKLKEHFKFQISKLDKVVVLCNIDKKLFQEEMGSNFVTIYNPLTVAPHGQGHFSNKRFLSVGRFAHKHKGFDILIKSFALFAKSHTDWVLDIVGEGPEESLYRSLITEYGLEEKVLLHPFTKNIQMFYSNASVYILSSRWEGFGLVLIEAMAHGLPVISSDIPVAKELMEGKNVALFFENENIEALANMMDSMVCHVDFEEMSRNALQLVEAFDINKISAEWNRLFKQLL